MPMCPAPVASSATPKNAMHTPCPLYVTSRRGMPSSSSTGNPTPSFIGRISLSPFRVAKCAGKSSADAMSPSPSTVTTSSGRSFSGATVADHSLTVSGLTKRIRSASPAFSAPSTNSARRPADAQTRPVRRSVTSSAAPAPRTVTDRCSVSTDTRSGSAPASGRRFPSDSIRKFRTATPVRPAPMTRGSMLTTPGGTMNVVSHGFPGLAERSP